MEQKSRGGFVRGTGQLSKMLADPEKNELASLIRQAMAGGGEASGASRGKEPTPPRRQPRRG